MEIKRVCALYFSATGNTEKTVAAFAETLAEQLGVPWERLPFTKPAERERDYMFADTDLVVVGTPTYAGKLPNKILPDLKARLHGNGALAAAIVTFGNRSYDNALAEYTKKIISSSIFTRFYNFFLFLLHSFQFPFLICLIFPGINRIPDFFHHCIIEIQIMENT